MNCKIGTRSVLRRRLAATVMGVAIAASSLILGNSPSNATEYAKQFYLLGSIASMGGFMPPPGTYVGAFKYFYSGDASGTAANSIALDQLGNINVQVDIDLDAQTYIEVPNALWVSRQKVLNGNFGLGLIVPVGWQEISADVDVNAALTLPNGTTFQRGRQFNISDETVSFGDPVLMSRLGWHRGNWHWLVQSLLNVPIGTYSKNNLANMGFNRWAFDTLVGVTWLNAERGHEISVNAGFTFNGENPDTNYRSGTAFHTEFALMQYVSKKLAFGLAGYHFEQVTGDSGAGAVLGSFKGRTTALGPNIDLNFQIGQTPVSTQLRWYREFDNVKNRMKGDVGFFQVTIPLGARRAAQTSMK